MEARYNCCKAIRKAFVSSELVSDPAFAGVGEKVRSIFDILCCFLS